MPTLSAAARDKLLAHAWPGNVRELENLVQRALILADGEQLQAADIHFEADEGLAPASAPATVWAEGAVNGGMPPAAGADAQAEEASAGRLSAGLRSLEDQIVLDALRAGGGSRKQAAEALGISPRTLRYKIARLREAGVAVP